MKHFFHIFLLIVSLTMVIGSGRFVRAQYEKKKEPPPTHEKKTTYRWPLSINNGFSSSFQEFRSNHFHAGLDLRTLQRTGYPVYAIADGVIYKIRMVKRGSGRGLYLKHDDGRTSIYFHLDRFEKRIENVLKQVQRVKGKKYIENYFLKHPLRYKAGQIIGYSGETGSGFPHLHLEIRDKRYFALNPFRFIEFPARDKNFPVLKGLLLRNRGHASINGTIGETYIEFRKTGSGSYKAQETPVITGNFDIVLAAYDISDTGKRTAPYSIAVSIGDRPYYRLTFDSFEGDDNNQLGFVYDMFYSSSSSYYFNLFSQEGYGLEQKKIPPDRIMDSLDYGKHEIRIRVTDNHNNTSIGRVPFYKTVKPGFETSGIVKSREENNGGNEYRVQMGIKKLVSDPAGEIKVYVYDGGGEKISSGTLGYHHIAEQKNFLLTGVSPEAAYMDFAFTAHNVLYFKKRFLLTGGHLPVLTDVPFDTYINRDEVFIRVKDIPVSAREIALTVIQGEMTQTLPALCGKDHVYFRFTPRGIDPGMPVLLHFSILQDNRKVAGIQKKLYLVCLEKGKKQRLNYREFEAEFGEKSVYEPRVLQLEETNYGSEYPVLSRQIDLSPYHFPFLDTVHYKFRKKLDDPRQAGIFQYNHKTGKWSYRYTVYDPASFAYRCRLISSGVFALMRDIFPPRVWFVRPRTQYKKNLSQVIVRITDKGKGVNDNTMKIWLNGKRICPGYECEYDPDRSYAKITGLGNLQVGKNLLKVEVKDYAGNLGSGTLVFYLK